MVAVALFRGKGHGCLGGGGGMGMRKDIWSHALFVEVQRYNQSIAMWVGWNWLLQQCQSLLKGSKYPWLFRWPWALNVSLPHSTTHVVLNPYGANRLGHETRDWLPHVFLVYKTSWWTRKEMTVETNKTLTLKNTVKSIKMSCAIPSDTLSFPTIVAQLHIVFFHLCRANAPVRKANMNVSLPTPWRLK